MIMNKSIYITLLFLLCGITTQAQDRKPLDLKELNANFDQIRSIKNWTSIKELSADSLTYNHHIYNYYYDGDTLKKVLDFAKTDTLEITKAYYILDEELSVVFELTYLKRNESDKPEIHTKQTYFEAGVLLHQIPEIPLNSKIRATESKRIFDNYNALITKLQEN
jgi:hypothetical protein